MLRTARSERFMTPEGQDHAAKMLDTFGIEGLIVIGGDGSFRGSMELDKLIAIANGTQTGNVPEQPVTPEPAPEPASSEENHEEKQAEEVESVELDNNDTSNEI